ncbi:pilin [Luteimonas sp. MJ246]|uniref:pilin n=1 Tax=Luteimonas sp. MJ174 TaxID=3129237 RepID=UPI0031BA2584
MKKMQGFTLIELMIVVAIIAILAAIALPAYQDYVARAQVSEAMSLSSGARTAVAEYYADRGDWPTTNAMAGLSPATSITGRYVADVTVAAANGVIEATMKGAGSASSKIAGDVFSLTPADAGGSITWNCNTATTTIDDKYLPSSCR